VGGIGLAASSNAATLVWRSNATGGVNWSDATLWNPAQAPANGDVIAFTSTPVTGGSRTTNNDLSNLSIDSVNVTVAAYALNGNALKLSGNSIAFSQTQSAVFDIGAPIELGQATTFNVVRSDSSTGTAPRINVNGVLSGAFGVTKTGVGTLRYQTNAKTYTGNTLVSAGTLDMSTDNMMPFGAGKGNLAIDLGASLFLNNVSCNINGLNDGPNGAGNVSKSGSGSRSLTLGNGDANGSFSGNITFTGGTTTSLNKVGAGTQTLSGAVSVIAAGSVSGGRLNVNGTWNTGINVSGGATLGGSGIISGTVASTTGGIISPGTSPGTLTVGGLTLNSTSVLNYELNGGNTTVGSSINDLINVTTAGGLTLNGTLNVSETVAGSFASSAGGTWRLINYSGALAGSGLTLGTIPTLPSGASLSIDTATAGQVNLVLTVPEPTSLLVLGATGLIAMKRRR
jgi:autotransporter-associated beta strand protein